MSQVVSIRLPDETANRFRKMAKKSGRSLNEQGALSLEEWIRQQEFAEIEFRSFGGERHACLKGALPLWQIVMVAKGFGMDAGKTAEYFGFPPYRVQAAFNYYEAFAAEINEAVEDNASQSYESLRRLLPGMNLVEIEVGDGASTLLGETEGTAEDTAAEEA